MNKILNQGMICIIILFGACEEVPLPDSLQYSYEQTYCSDPWGDTSDSEELLDLVKEYLADRDIEVLSPSVQSGEMSLCRACTCTSGLRISIGLSEEDGQKLLDLNEGWKAE
ncbi:MAG: hypothetical protein AAFR87_10590 [Bacteroidota bacterium]